MRMSGGMDACDRNMKACRAMACGLAVLLGNARIPQAVAGTIPGHPATLAVSREDATRVAGANGLSFSVQDIEAEPGKDTPIAMVIPSPAELRDAGAEEGTFILIRNIPEGISVSAGMATGRIWVVPLREARTLRLISKQGMNARFQLGFHLIGPNNRILAESNVSVAVRPRESVAAIGAPFAKTEVPTAAAPKPETPKKPVQQQTQAAPLAPQDEAVLLERGKEVLQQGGIAAARLIFEQLAARGSAAGALALARSYDPAHAAPSPAPALAPNMTVALKWYERAAELGNPDAKRRLAEIVPGG
jgi:hypothetical protein